MPGRPTGRPRVPDAANVLLLAPALASSDDRVCADLVRRGPSTDVAALQIDLTRSSADLLSHVSSDPGRSSLRTLKRVSVGHPPRPHADGRPGRGGAPTGPRGPPTHVEVGSVGSAGDLTALGVEITETLTEWDRRPLAIGFCFHSLTPLFQYADLDRVYRFLHVITGRLSAVGARAHFHLDPNAHDDRTVSTLQTLFDAAVEVADDGTVETRAR